VDYDNRKFHCLGQRPENAIASTLGARGRNAQTSSASDRSHGGSHHCHDRLRSLYHRYEHQFCEPVVMDRACRHIDRTIHQFLGEHPWATIVNLGCGLDTTFERVDNGKLLWYDLDLPDVVELRSHYIEQGPRRRFIASSILDEAWMDSLDSAVPTLFIAGGVLYYLKPEKSRLSCAD
jgi:O-methyltransferase involved in polyketide biosynthesis